MPINLLFGGAAAYNFCLILALTLSGFGMYLLVRELTSSPSAGFVAGLVFAYFPQTVEQTLEHLNLFSAQFIPLALYYLVRWARSRRTADALAWGACIGLNALCSWHLGVKLALVALPWLAWFGWKSRSEWRLHLRGAAAGGTAALLLVLPMLVPMVVLIASGADYYVKPPVPRGIDASYLLTPAYANPLLGSWGEARYLDRAYQAAGFVCYMGFIPLGLALYGFFAKPQPDLRVARPGRCGDFARLRLAPFVGRDAARVRGFPVRLDSGRTAPGKPASRQPLPTACRPGAGSPGRLRLEGSSPQTEMGLADGGGADLARIQLGSIPGASCGFVALAAEGRRASGGRAGPAVPSAQSNGAQHGGPNRPWQAYRRWISFVLPAGDSPRP